MPTLTANKSLWGTDYNWEKHGDEWSAGWGTVAAEWHGSIYPRISSFLPASSVLEIAPGFGRWTQYLESQCHKLTLVDLTPKCIEACKKRFRDRSHISYFVNDGKSLDMIPDQSVDFLFSFDSLVHAEADVMEAYVAQFQRILTKDGVAFIHHSNLGAYSLYHSSYSLINKVPKLPRLLEIFGVDNVARQWRAPSMTAEKMVSFARANHLRCTGQELITWQTRYVLIDAISILTKIESKWPKENFVLKNRGFMKDAKLLSRVFELYGRTK